METIEPTDVLVAATDRNATKALALGDRLAYVARDRDRTAAALADAERRQLHEVFIKRYRRNLEQAEAALGDVEAAYYPLLEGLPRELVRRVEEIVWRDRKAEYAHAREVMEREDANR